MSYLKYIWKLFLAYFHIDSTVVCEMSKGKGNVDYHDYRDDEHKLPLHFMLMKCERCGKEFTI